MVVSADRVTARTAVSLLLLLCCVATERPDGQQVPETTEFRPALATPETMVPFLEHLDPGDDGFPLERQARELETRLRELSEALRAGSTGLPALASRRRRKQRWSLHGRRPFPPI
jgi:hypothetical protein